MQYERTASSPGLSERADAVDVALRDGSALHLRPVRGEDGPAVLAFLQSLSPQSVGLRFFGAPDLRWASEWSTDVDYDRLAGIRCQYASRWC